MSAADLIRERIRRQGPIRFDEFMDLALYAPGAGFYEAGGRAGRDGDFLTSPEVGPLYGAVVARAFDTWWRDLGEPDPFFVIEAGAGRGVLASAVLAASPVCASALRYVLVERSAAQREQQRALVSLDLPAHALGPSVTTADGEPEPATGVGPIATALAELPAGPFTGVVFANELLDNLPFRLLERGRGGWCELLVGDDLEFLAVEAPSDVLPVVPGGAAEGSRVPLQHRAAEWLRAALGVIDRGRVVAVDYADTTHSLAARPAKEWLRTYRRHGPGGDPLEAPGSQDITCEVAVDQLARVRVPSRDTSQVAFLAEHGLGDLAAEARAAWQARAHIGDLEALRHRSRANEAAALVDPAGLGAFRVLEWEVGARR